MSSYFCLSISFSLTSQSFLSDPALAKEVALTPSDKKDWDVSEKDVENKRASVEDMSAEELEAATAPTPGSRNR